MVDPTGRQAGPVSSETNVPARSYLPGPGPIFLFTMHRGGGTLLQRVINAHPDVMIWGEHGGFINKLAEIDSVMSHYGNVAAPPDPRHLSDFMVHRGRESFDPWTNPVDRIEFRRIARDFIQNAFTTGTRRDQRWGFKEIRYHSIQTARFLLELFPWSRIVILKRDLASVVTSCIMAPWSLRLLGDVDSDRLREVVRDVACAVAAMAHGDERIARQFPHRVTEVNLERIGSELPDMFDFLRLSVPDVTGILRNRIGATDENATVTSLDRSGLTALAEDALSAAADQIGRIGVDERALRSSRHGYLVGDHDLFGTGLSSLF